MGKSEPCMNAQLRLTNRNQEWIQSSLSRMGPLRHLLLADLSIKVTGEVVEMNHPKRFSRCAILRR